MSARVPVLDQYEWQKSVLDKDLSTPPSNPSRGDRYIVGYNPSGDWFNKPKQIAEWTGTIWEFTAYMEGMVAYVMDEGIQYQYAGARWRPFPNRVKRIIDVHNSDISLAVNDAGKVIRCDSTSAVTYSLPSVSSSDIGLEFTFLRTGSGKLTLQAADNDRIEDSGPGETIENDPTHDSANASITIMLADETQWVLMSGNGTWVTTDST